MSTEIGVKITAGSPRRLPRECPQLIWQCSRKCTRKCAQSWWPYVSRYRDTIIVIPHMARYFVREVSTPSKWCETPPLVLSFTQVHLCHALLALQHLARELCDTPQKQAQSSSTMLSLQLSRDMKFSKVSPLGL